MAKKERAAAAAAQQGEGLKQNERLVEFCAQLTKRWPDHVIKRFVMPSTVRAPREVFIRELTSKDEIQAAIWADAGMSPIEKCSNKLSADAERREAIRISIVGVGDREGGVNAPDGAQLAYRMANHDGDLFDEPNGWKMSAWGALSAYFYEVNGVPVEEIGAGILEARAVGALASQTSGNPTSAIPASADRGR